MTNPYGPWATAIDAGGNPQLSAFWWQRLMMLVPASQTSSSLSRRRVALIITAAILICSLPTFRIRIATAEAQKAHDEKGNTNMTQLGESAKHAESLTYSGKIVDKVTGKPIAGATVTVRRSLLTPNDNRMLEEPQYKTDAAGKYTFTISPEQVADRYLYIELDVSHPERSNRG